MRDDVMLLALPEVHADITNAWQDGSRLTFFPNMVMVDVG